ncbi:MAG: hypothetical protein WBW31_19360 [Candidatus Sulfotelmatobacter sp.]
MNFPLPVFASRSYSCGLRTVDDPVREGIPLPLFLDDEEADGLGVVLTATLTLPNWPTPTRIGVVCGTRDGAFSRR